ncbi:unnamed protein product, partial [Laminaria digitata]
SVEGITLVQFNDKTCFYTTRYTKCTSILRTGIYGNIILVHIRISYIPGLTQAVFFCGVRLFVPPNTSRSFCGVRLFVCTTFKRVSPKKQAVEGEHFRGMVHALKDNARLPDRQEILTTMRTVKQKLMAKIEVLLRGEHVTITTDSWRSRRTGDAFVSVSANLIAKNWKRVSLMLDCAKFSDPNHSGSEDSGSEYPGLATAAAAAAEEEASLAERTQTVLKSFDSLERRVFACVTGCDPVMVEMGVSLEAEGVCPHVVCCDHRLGRSASVVLESPAIKEAVRLARGLAARYSRSREAAARLGETIAAGAAMEDEELDPASASVNVIQEVRGRWWWSSCAMLERLVHLQPAIKRHEEEDGLEPLLDETGWKVLELVLPVLEPFVATRSMLDGEVYAAGSLVVPLIFDVRGDLETVFADLKAAAAAAVEKTATVSSSAEEKEKA